MSTLEHKLQSNALWMLITRAVVKGLGLISTLILVRLLTPEDFGLVAIAMSVYAFIELFGMFGFSAAIIQKTAPTKDDYDATFTINFIFGCVASLILALSSGGLSVYFGDLRLQEIFYVLSFLFLVQGLKNIKVIDFQKHMNFQKEFKFQLIPKLISFFVTLFLAWSLKSYLALIYGMTFNAFFTIIYSYYVLPYKPAFRFKGADDLFRFSKWLMLNNLFVYINNKSIDFIVGKYISANAAGIYSISQEVASIPISEIGAPINKASYPAYSKAKDDIYLLTKLYYRTCSIITLLALPSALGLFVVSEFFVPVVLGEKWLGAIEVIHILSVAAFISSLSSNNGYILMAIGKPNLTTFIAALRISIFLVFLWILFPFENILFPAVALLISVVFDFVISFLLLKYELKISFRAVLLATYRPLLSSFIMFLLIYLLQFFYSFDVSISSLIFMVVVGVSAYTTFIYLLWFIAGKPDSIEKNIFDRIHRMLNA